jgi:hypothetical protein
MPISCVHSVTTASMMFMMTMPLTTMHQRRSQDPQAHRASPPDKPLQRQRRTGNGKEGIRMKNPIRAVHGPTMDPWAITDM